MPPPDGPTVEQMPPERDSPAANAGAGGSKRSDVLRDLAPGLLPRLIALMVHEFILQRAPKAFHRGIVVAIAFPTHRHGHAKLAQPSLIVLGTILGPAIRVVD